MSQDNTFQSKVGDAPIMYPPPPITNQPQAVLVQSPQPQFGPRSQRVTCPSCHNTDMSEIKHENSSKTHMMAVFLCVTTLVTINMSVPLGPVSCNLQCPQCKEQITTDVRPKASTKPHLIALLLTLFGCCFYACCLYCTDCARNSEHFCPSCNAFLGVYER